MLKLIVMQIDSTLQGREAKLGNFLFSCISVTGLPLHPSLRQNTAVRYGIARMVASGVESCTDHVVGYAQRFPKKYRKTVQNLPLNRPLLFLNLTSRPSLFKTFKIMISNYQYNVGISMCSGFICYSRKPIIFRTNNNI